MYLHIQQTDQTTSHYYVFWGDDSESNLQNQFRKNCPHVRFGFFKNAWEVKNINVKIISIRGLKCVKWWEDSKSVLRIHIGWHLNFLLAKKLSKIRLIGDLAKFRPFLAQKGAKCYPILILRPHLESSYHFTYIRPLFDIVFTFWFFFTTHAFS